MRKDKKKEREGRVPLVWANFGGGGDRFVFESLPLEGVGGGGAPRAFARGIFFSGTGSRNWVEIWEFTDGISVHGRGAGGQESQEKSKKTIKKTETHQLALFNWKDS